MKVKRFFHILCELTSFRHGNRDLWTVRSLRYSSGCYADCVLKIRTYRLKCHFQLGGCPQCSTVCINPGHHADIVVENFSVPCIIGWGFPGNEERVW